MRGRCDDIGCWVGRLARGCELCMEGLKTTVFITGVCPERCYYCPVSPERRGRDVFFVNEVRARSANDVILEAVASGSAGVGVTGGDPLARLDRTVEVVKALKDFFGSRFHVHLYTSGALLTDEAMEELVNAGLDEVRIHVTGERSWEAVRTALKHPVDVGVENPAIPGMAGELKGVVERAFREGVKFVNLNELEFSEGNMQELLARGFRAGSNGVAAAGSREVGVEVVKWVEDEGMDISVHYCPAAFKDRYQFRLRLKRRALRTARVFEEVGDGVVSWARLTECPSNVVRKLVLAGLAFSTRDGVVTKPSIARALNCPHELVEAYPLTPRLVLNVRRAASG